MSEVNYSAMGQLVEGMKTGDVVPVYLLHGDEFLYKNAFQTLLDVMVPEKERTLNYEALDGVTVGAEEVIGRLNTFPLLSGSKVIALHDTRVFYSKVSAEELASKSREAFKKEDLMGACRYFVHMLSTLDLSFDDVNDGQLDRVWEKGSSDNRNIGKGESGLWLKRVVEHCFQEKIEIPGHDDAADLLSEAIVAGIPGTNHLVLTTDFVDKRRKLYKTIKKVGVIVDCSISQGTKWADEKERKGVLKTHMKKALAQEGKTADAGLFEALYEKTGANLRTFAGEIEKLVSFVGDRKEISVDDVAKALDKSKQDPIYELGNAIGERDIAKTLFYVDSLLKANFYPLQILSAAIKQVRRLILGKDLVRICLKGKWSNQLDYGRFQKMLLPELKGLEEDSLVKEVHPYVLFKTLEFSENYTFRELLESLEILLQADRALKSSGQSSKLVLERAIMEICGIPA